MSLIRIAIVAIAAVTLGATTVVAQTKSEQSMFTVAGTLGTSGARDSELGGGFPSHNLNLLFLSSMAITSASGDAGGHL